MSGLPKWTDTFFFLVISSCIYRSIYLSNSVPYRLNIHISIEVIMYISICLSTYFSALYLSIFLCKCISHASSRTIPQLRCRWWIFPLLLLGARWLSLWPLPMILSRFGLCVVDVVCAVCTCCVYSLCVVFAVYVRCVLVVYILCALCVRCMGFFTYVNQHQENATILPKNQKKDKLGVMADMRVYCYRRDGHWRNLQ